MRCYFFLLIVRSTCDILVVCAVVGSVVCGLSGRENDTKRSALSRQGMGDGGGGRGAAAGGGGVHAIFDNY